MTVRIDGVIYEKSADFFAALKAAERAEAIASWEALPTFLICPFPHDTTMQLSKAPYAEVEGRIYPSWNGLACGHIFMSDDDLWHVRCQVPVRLPPKPRRVLPPKPRRGRP